MRAVTVVAVIAGVAATALSSLRWLRVAQREHYLPGSVTRFAARWWRTTPLNAGLVAVAVAGAVAAWWWPWAALVTAAAVAVGPRGLSLRGRTSPLRWTRRLRTLAVATAVVVAVAVAVLAVLGPPAGGAALVALLTPLVVDGASVLTAPLERRLSNRHVDRAAARLARLAPTVVAITGSYGKTSTKGYVAHLLAGRYAVVASPASFNNRAGLARAVNEHLAEGTDVFVAEMGTYGPGEIAELCSWITPDVAVITALGPVHLERFGTEERILAAKAEILADAPAAVLAVDDDRLAALADRVEAEGKRVRRCSTVDRAADVFASRRPSAGVVVVVAGQELAASAPVHARAGNVACAVAVALEVGVPVDEVAARLATLPTVAHRLEPTVGSGGGVVLDDTYNANPAGARVALDQLAAAAPGGRRVLVTPGMVELGRRQADENARFAAAAAGVVTDLVVVGATNRRALLAGARRAAAADGAPARSPGAGEPIAEPHVVTLATRDQAVAWVRHHVGPGDAVLYENDLPDHYP